VDALLIPRRADLSDSPAFGDGNLWERQGAHKFFTSGSFAGQGPNPCLRRPHEAHRRAKKVWSKGGAHKLFSGYIHTPDISIHANSPMFW